MCNYEGFILNNQNQESVEKEWEKGKGIKAEVAKRGIIVRKEECC